MRISLSAVFLFVIAMAVMGHCICESKNRNEVL